MKFLFLILSFFLSFNLNAQNIGIGVADPVTKLEVKGSFKVSAIYESTSTMPTPAQTLTMINANTLGILPTDSVAVVYDPGGPAGNYNANLNAALLIYGNGSPMSYLELSIELIDLGTGDSLIIYEGTSINSSILYKAGNGFNASNLSISFPYNQGYVVFKSNADIYTGTGFSLLFKRKFINSTATEQPATTGSALIFYPEKAALKAGFINSSAIGNNSVAIGNRATASKDYCVAMGNFPIASGYSSTAIGYAPIATGNYSSAIGHSTKASGDYSSALGANTKATGNYSSAMGRNSTASGEYATAMGYNVKASGTTSTAMGGTTTASGLASTAMGVGTRAMAYILAAGRYNAFGASHSETDWIQNEYAFIIGDGTSDADRSNSFYLLKNGNGWMRGTLTQASDERLKKNILKIDNAIPKLKNLSGYNYHWINDEALPQLQAGLIAQEVQKQMPELVSASNADGELAVNYSGMVPYLLEGIKEQQEEIELQNKKIEMLENEMKAIKKILLGRKKK